MIIIGGCCYSNLSANFLLWIVYAPSYSVNYSVLRSHRKNDTALALPPELLVFMSVALAPRSLFSWLQLRLLSFLQINILLTWCASSWIENELNQVHKTKRIHQTFLSNLVWKFFTSSALTMRKSAKKQQSQIQRTVTSRNVTQDNGNMNNFWKGSRWFCRQCVEFALQPQHKTSLDSGMQLIKDSTTSNAS